MKTKPGLLRTLLQAIGGGDGTGPGGQEHTEIFIGPNMQRVHPAGLGGAGPRGTRGGGGGGGGSGESIAAVRLGAALGSGFGAFMRGFALAGGGGMAGIAGLGGGGGNFGDYAFGDLSQLIQQLMAADPNRVRSLSHLFQIILLISTS